MKPLKLKKSTVKNSKLLTARAKKWAFENWQYLTATNTPLLNIDSSAKLKKGADYVAILYMKPADHIAVKTICAAANLYGCKKPCLESSGQLGMAVGDNAKIKRTILYLLFPNEFKKELKREIIAHSKKYKNLWIRLNGTSDLDWSKFIASMPNNNFYDYSKIYIRVIKNKLKNYDLTFSGSGYSDLTIKHTAKAIKAGAKTALVINTAETNGEYKRPSMIGDIPLIDMDKTDHRFKDPAKSVGTLKRKGSNKKERALAEKNNYDFAFTVNNFNKLAALVK